MCDAAQWSVSSGSGNAAAMLLTSFAACSKSVLPEVLHHVLVITHSNDITGQLLHD